MATTITHFKGISFATLTGLPFFSWTFLALGDSDVTNWTYESLHGLYTRVKLLIDEGNSSQSAGTTVVVSSGTSSASIDSKQKFSLFAEIPLASINKMNWYKYCISNKLLDSDRVTSTVATNSSGEGKCRLKWFSPNRTNMESNISADTLRYLLRVVKKFLEVQHATNMLMIYDKATRFHWDKNRESNNESTGRNNLDDISSGCSLSHISNKAANGDDGSLQNVLKGLFTSPTIFSKKCLLSPSELELNIKINGSSENMAQTTSTSTTPSKSEINIDNLSKATIKGHLKYGLFSYSAKLKKILSRKGLSSGGKKYTSWAFKINWPLVYSLEGLSDDSKPTTNNKCLLKRMKDLVESKELKMETIKKECVVDNPK